MAEFPDPEVGRKPLVGSDKPDTESRRYSIREFVDLLHRRRLVMCGIIAGLLLLCALYCLIVPNQYEASARVALRMQPVSSLTLETTESFAPASILSTPLQLETLVNVLRSEQLVWWVITQLKLYEKPAFSKSFAGRFPGFDPAKPGPEAQGYLLEAFNKRLHVRALPRTLLIEIRYRSKDPALAADVANALIRGYGEMESRSRMEATEQSAGWLQGQLRALTVKTQVKEQELSEFERKHGFMSTQQALPGGQPVETLHESTIYQVDEAGRQLAAASGDRILREALYREAQAGNPEQVLAANPELQAEMGPGGAAMVQQLRTHWSEVGVELAQLRAEHGPNFPRVVELQRAMADIEQQLKTEDENLVEAFRRTWKAAGDREELLRKEFAMQTESGLKQNDATLQYAVLHEEVVSGRELESRLRRRIEEAGLAAGVRASSITVVDYARIPFKPVTPDLPLYLGITFVAGSWLAVGAALLLDALRPPVRTVTMAALLVMVLGVGSGWAQAPTPSTSGLPTGVVRLPQDQPAVRPPNPKEAPPVWNAPAESLVGQDSVARPAGISMALPIGTGDLLDVQEFHTPEFHSGVRVSEAGTVMLPLVGELRVMGLTEQDAAKAIEKALVADGMLVHPQVTVLVTAAVGQDVSILGEVVRPGVYAYTAHHRLLDLISVASGLSQSAGRLVNIYHRDDPRTAHPVVLESNVASGPNAADAKVEHNPELMPGDTVQVSRAGLVYVIGDVVRPGGFAVDPAQGLTVVQALSLAWGSTPNAAVGKAILIRDQPGGRTLTTLNLKRMIRGQDPDQRVRDRDILFVPDSTAKNLLNKTLESAIQSAVGVSIYAGLVYSQRF